MYGEWCDGEYSLVLVVNSFSMSDGGMVLDVAWSDVSRKCSESDMHICQCMVVK